MKTITNTTAKIIGLTSSNYQAEIFNIYWNYCRSKSRTDAELQLLLINQPLNKWFLREINALEYNFKEDVKPFIGTSQPFELLKIWKSAMLQIFTLHSFTLINRVRSNKTNNFKPHSN